MGESAGLINYPSHYHSMVLTIGIHQQRSSRVSPHVDANIRRA